MLNMPFPFTALPQEDGYMSSVWWQYLYGGIYRKPNSNITAMSTIYSTTSNSSVAIQMLSIDNPFTLPKNWWTVGRKIILTVCIGWSSNGVNSTLSFVDNGVSYVGTESNYQYYGVLTISKICKTIGSSGTAYLTIEDTAPENSTAPALSFSGLGSISLDTTVPDTFSLSLSPAAGKLIYSPANCYATLEEV